VTQAPDATDPIQAARHAEDLGAWEQALNLCRQARIHDPHNSRITRATARCLRRLGQPQQAAVLLEQQLQLQPEALPLQLATLEALAEASRWQAQLASLAPLLNALPEDPELLALLQQASDHLQPLDPGPADRPATDRLAALRPWLPQRLRLVCALPDISLDETCRRLPPPAQATPWHLAATLPSVPPDTEVQLAPLDLAAHLPLWRTLIDQRGLQATVVVLSLHPVLALPALQQQFGLDVNSALGLWCRHLLLVERHSRDLPRQRLAATAPPSAAVPPAADPSLLAQALDLHQALLHPDDDHCRREADRLAADPSHSNAVEVAQRLNLEAQAAADRGDLDLAVPLYRQAMAQMPQHRGLYPALARCLRRLDRAAEAEALLSRHLPEQPDSAPGWIGLA
jgi:tetratricopeptide (TPR) repeat protein